MAAVPGATGGEVGEAWWANSSGGGRRVPATARVLTAGSAAGHRLGYPCIRLSDLKYSSIIGLYFAGSSRVRSSTTFLRASGGIVPQFSEYFRRSILSVLPGPDPP